MSTTAYVQVLGGLKQVCCAPSSIIPSTSFLPDYIAGSYTLWTGFAQKVLSSRENLCSTLGSAGGRTIHQEANLLSTDFKVAMNFLNMYANVHFLGKELSDFLEFS